MSDHWTHRRCQIVGPTGRDVRSSDPQEMSDRRAHEMSDRRAHRRCLIVGPIGDVRSPGPQKMSDRRPIGDVRSPGPQKMSDRRSHRRRCQMAAPTMLPAERDIS